MGGSNGPWRGHFGSGFEGGMRTPAIVRWPGKVKAGSGDRRDLLRGRLVADAGVARRRERAGARPTARSTASTRRHSSWASSATTGRDHVIYYGSDAAVMSVKWKTMKVVFRYTESASGPIIKPQWPLIFDLIDDPNEEWDLMEKRLDCAWVILPVAQRLGALAAERGALPATSSRVKSSFGTRLEAGRSRLAQ